MSQTKSQDGTGVPATNKTGSPIHTFNHYKEQNWDSVVTRGVAAAVSFLFKEGCYLPAVDDGQADRELAAGGEV